MITLNRACRSVRSVKPWSLRRWLSQSTLDRLAEPVQSYISTSRDPYLNLSIEHYLLQKTAPESAVLLLYINRPSIIIGRNQNPWLEVNLALLDPAHGTRPETEPPGIGAVDLVRRRSGGGTVFHDEGNVNWTVICPSKDFTRDRHAEMVVRALRSCGVDRSRVNERHDIVLDQGSQPFDSDPGDTHVTPWTSANAPTPLKVSGSAYKLTRQRALHHGTCLLSSPNLNIIPDYLHSPAKPYITARGVESVSSPVGNILLSNENFIATVQQQFAQMYARDTGRLETQVVSDKWLEHEPVRKGRDELKSLEWTYLQTPQFSISNKAEKSAKLEVELTVRNGAVTGTAVGPRGQPPRTEIPDSLAGLRVHEVASWQSKMSPLLPNTDAKRQDELAGWLQKMLPPPTSGSSV